MFVVRISPLDRSARRRHGALVNASQQSSRLFQREWGDEDRELP